MICPHVITEHAEDAVSYCQICAPKYIIKLKKWIDDLQSGNWITCVYCGHRYGPRESTPTSMADILKEHIEKCPKHPMSKLKTQLTKYQELVKYAQHFHGSEGQQCCDLLAKGFGFEKKCTCGLSGVLVEIETKK